MAMFAQYSVAVIGLGLIGSSACRHLSHMATDPSRILGIGAAEPVDASSTVFASHYDQGRVTRVVDRDPVWSQLAARSISSYRDIENTSRVLFHGDCGFIRVSPCYGEPGDTLKESLEVGLRNGAVVKHAAKSDFSYFGFDERDVAVIEHGGAGYINPRELVRAQLTIASSNGVHLVHETVSNIEPALNGGVRIFTRTGKVYQAARVLLCTGAYTNFLLPNHLNLSVKVIAVSALLAEVNNEEASRLHGMPSFIWRLKGHHRFHSVYGCPPILYPDGKYYIKIGGEEWQSKLLTTEAELLEWFTGPGSKAETDALVEVLLQLLPGLRFGSLKTKPCVVSYSAHNYPYVDKLANDVFVATFGCGAAAKSSDEIGKMASLLVFNGEWAYPELPASLFHAVFVDKSSSTSAPTDEAFLVKNK